MRQFILFATVGTAGLIVDLAVLRLYLTGFPGHQYSGQALGWAVAVTTNWSLNRRFTFRDRGERSRLVEWARFVAVNSVGGGVNYAVYAGLVATWDRANQHPSIAVMLGTIAGLGFNFIGSKFLVFRTVIGAAGQP